jgi:hypothetical protein
MVCLEGFVCSTLYLAVLVWGLGNARSLFKRVAVGLIFEPQTGVLLRRFGVVLVVYAALIPFVGALMSLLVTMHNIPGERLFRFGISDEEIVLAIVVRSFLRPAPSWPRRLGWRGKTGKSSRHAHHRQSRHHARHTQNALEGSR